MKVFVGFHLGELYVNTRFWFKHISYSYTIFVSFKFLENLGFCMNMFTRNQLLQNVWLYMDVLVSFGFLHMLKPKMLPFLCGMGIRCIYMLGRLCLKPPIFVTFCNLHSSRMLVIYLAIGLCCWCLFYYRCLQMLIFG